MLRVSKYGASRQPRARGGRARGMAGASFYTSSLARITGSSLAVRRPLLVAARPAARACRHRIRHPDARFVALGAAIARHALVHLVRHRLYGENTTRLCKILGVIFHLEIFRDEFICFGKANSEIEMPTISRCNIKLHSVTQTGTLVV